MRRVNPDDPYLTWDDVDSLIHDAKSRLVELSKMQCKLNNLKTKNNDDLERLYEIVLRQHDDILAA